MHVMLDLETMGTAKEAAIIAIGAIRFDLETKIVEKEGFYRVVNLKSAQRAGGKIDAETVMWWLKQSEAARGALTGDDSVLIDTALRDFSNWLRETPVEGIWGNGSDFDNVILEGAYQRQGWTTPWSHKLNRCYRTICSLWPEVKRETIGIKHNALDDAISQAHHLCEIIA